MYKKSTIGHFLSTPFVALTFVYDGTWQCRYLNKPTTLSSTMSSYLDNACSLLAYILTSYPQFLHPHQATLWLICYLSRCIGLKSTTACCLMILHAVSQRAHYLLASINTNESTKLHSITLWENTFLQID